MTSFRSTVFLATLGLVAATAIVPTSPAANTYTVYPGTVSSTGANLVTTVSNFDVGSCIANCDGSISCVAVAFDLTLHNNTPCSSYYAAGDLASPARVVISPASAYGGSVYFKNAGAYMNSFAPAPGSSLSPGPALLIADSNTASCISSPANYPADAFKRGSTQFLYQDVCYSSACPSNTVSAAAQGDYVTCQCAPHFVAGAPVGNEPGNCVACGPNVATCSLTAALTCNAGYKIGEMGAILTPHVAGETCVCNDNYALTCDADGALTCSAGYAPVYAPVNNDDFSNNAPTYVCAPCNGYFTRNSVLTLIMPKVSEFTCIVCPANTSVPAATGRFSTCACGSDSEFYVNTYNKCFYDGVPPTNGVNGMHGKDGMNGTTGAAGINGTNGIDGRNGTNGTTGPSGMDGINGTNGIDGARGPRGRQGRPGPKGKKGKNAPVIIVVAPSHHGHSKDHRHGHGHRA